VTNISIASPTIMLYIQIVQMRPVVAVTPPSTSGMFYLHWSDCAYQSEQILWSVLLLKKYYILWMVNIREDEVY